MESFLTLLYDSYDRLLPTKFKPKVSRKDSSPWITNDIIILKRKNISYLISSDEDRFRGIISVSIGTCLIALFVLPNENISKQNFMNVGKTLNVHGELLTRCLGDLFKTQLLL